MVWEPPSQGCLQSVKETGAYINHPSDLIIISGRFCWMISLNGIPIREHCDFLFSFFHFHSTFSTYVIIQM